MHRHGKAEAGGLRRVDLLPVQSTVAAAEDAVEVLNPELRLNRPKRLMNRWLIH